MDAEQTQSTPRPNILVSLTDDHGQWASGCYGNRELFTPSLDYLARTGARMARAFTPSPVCSPARASFFTGKLPSQHGVHDWLAYDRDPSRPSIEGQRTIAQLLQGAGYYTGLVGKWHCGDEAAPKAGFDRWFGYYVNQYPHFGDLTLSDQGERLDQFGHQVTRFTDRAIEFLNDRPKDRPFFLTVGYVATHTPHAMQPERLVSHYRRCRFDDVPAETFSPVHGVARIPARHENRQEELAQYYASVTFIDEQVGRIIDELENTGELENTLIVYTSDHGHMNGHHGLHTKGNATVPQNFLDESILVPCLLRWPGVIPERTVRSEPVDHCDLFQTLLDAAGIARPEEEDGTGYPGASFLPLLRGEEMRWREEQFCEYGNARMIRTDRYKLILRYPGPNGHFKDELYDLADDPKESVNRIDDKAYEGVARRLSAKLESHFTKFEIPEKSGRNIAAQPVCNQKEPWRVPL